MAVFGPVWAPLGQGAAGVYPGGLATFSRLPVPRGGRTGAENSKPRFVGLTIRVFSGRSHAGAPRKIRPPSPMKAPISLGIVFESCFFGLPRGPAVSTHSLDELFVPWPLSALFRGRSFARTEEAGAGLRQLAYTPLLVRSPPTLDEKPPQPLRLIGDSQGCGWQRGTLAIRKDVVPEKCCA